MTNIEIIRAVRQAIVPRNPEQAWIVDNILFLHVAGSRLYGTSNEGSDWDIRGVTLAPKSYWVGARSFEQVEAKVPELGMDIVIYDFRKWLQMTVNVNPNVVETLYAEWYCITSLTTQWNWIRSRVLPLVNQRAHAGYHGYALSQLKKMMVKQKNKTGRVALAEFGYDSKFLGHGFRLARQGIELLTTGTITFPRPDADDLLAIRNGLKYGPDETDRAIADWEVEASKLDDALTNSVLPVKADFDKYDQLLQEVYDTMVDPRPQSIRFVGDNTENFPAMPPDYATVAPEG